MNKRQRKKLLKKRYGIWWRDMMHPWKLPKVDNPYTMLTAQEIVYTQPLVKIVKNEYRFPVHYDMQRQVYVC